METNAAILAARAFTHNLNILLKTARLYGLDHERTSVLLQAAWSELRAALKDSGDTGVLLGVSGSQVLLDGAPLEAKPTDRSFANLLSSAGLCSIQFTQAVTYEDFSQFARIFANRRPTAGPLVAELKAALSGDGPPTIRINEIRFVAQDAKAADTALAAQIAVSSLGADADKLQAWLSDPKKLLQLMAAAEGARGEPVAPSDGPPQAQSQARSLEERDVMEIIGVLCELGQAGRSPGDTTQPGQFEQRLGRIPLSAHVTITDALASLSAVSPVAKTNTPLLVQVAEHIAIRFALERYERGDSSVNSVVQLLERMKREIKALRKVLQGHEEKMGRAGLEVESYSDALDREFWAAVPALAKRKILLSPEAWAIPPANIRQFATELLDRGDAKSAAEILSNYAACAHAADLEARRRTALGLTDLADIYVRADGVLLHDVIAHVGEQLKGEQDAELQTLLGATFVRFSHEAASKHDYPAVGRALASLDDVEKEQPALADLLWPRIKVGNRIEGFIEDAVLADHLPADLISVLKRMPEAAVEQVANRLSRCTRREECDRLVGIVRELGAERVACLRKTLAEHSPREAVSTVALLARLDPVSIEELLPARLREWDALDHDQVVRQIACSGAPGRGKLLANLLDLLEPIALPEALDEIGMSGDKASGRTMLNIVEKGLDPDGDPFLRIKAIEALGRLRDSNASPLLQTLVEAKQLWRWRYPRELRITAAQALKKFDPEWAARCLPASGLSEAELNLGPLDPEPAAPWIRQRRYLRVQLSRAIRGVVLSPQGDCRLLLTRLSLGGGVATCQRYLKLGSVTKIALHPGLGRIQADVLVREVRPQQVSFELVRISLADRHKLRGPIAQSRAIIPTAPL